MRLPKNGRVDRCIGYTALLESCPVTYRRMGRGDELRLQYEWRGVIGVRARVKILVIFGKFADIVYSIDAEVKLFKSKDSAPVC